MIGGTNPIVLCQDQTSIAREIPLVIMIQEIVLDSLIEEVSSREEINSQHLFRSVLASLFQSRQVRENDKYLPISRVWKHLSDQ